MRKMLISLTPSSIGVQANQAETIEYAHHFGYEAAQPLGDELAAMSTSQISDLRGKMKELKLQWGQGGLMVDFRKDEETFRTHMKDLPKFAAGLQAAGATRVGTWIAPNHDSLPYIANFRQHEQRIREIGKVFADHGVRLGLEYVGPKTLWAAKRFPFIHTMAETRELLSTINLSTVGLVLDSWHWYTAGESAADLKTLRNEDIVCVDLNDAPKGIPVDRQIDSQRELPLATGVIDVSSFLQTLAGLGCDAPVRPEPFNAALRARPKEEILATALESMRRAMQLVV